MSSKVEKVAEEGGTVRVKFQCKWLGTVSSLYSENPGLEERVRVLEDQLADVLWELDQAGAAPVCPDGKVGGNAAAQFTVEDKVYFLVSKSGKDAKRRMVDADFCVVTDFDVDHWSCQYLACDDTVLPTSDTPLHVTALSAGKQLNWLEEPTATLHGHALETEEAAKRCGLPISSKETLFSTQEDSTALFNLLKEYPYPEHKIFIRKNHGFILLDASVADATMTFNEKLKPLLRDGH